MQVDAGIRTCATTWLWPPGFLAHATAGLRRTKNGGKAVWRIGEAPDAWMPWTLADGNPDEDDYPMGPIANDAP